MKKSLIIFHIVNNAWIINSAIRAIKIGKRAKKQQGRDMLLGELPFGTFEEVEPNIMEITINQGVQMSEKNIEEIEEGLLEKYQGEYALLINRKNAYSHGHESLARISTLKNVSFIAIIVYSEASFMAAKIHQIYSKNVQIFTSRNAALNWLKQNQ